MHDMNDEDDIIEEYHLEDVAIDIRAMTDGHKLYKWQYQNLLYAKDLLRSMIGRYNKAYEFAGYTQKKCL